MPGYRQVFLSHSRQDPNLDFFHKVFSGVGAKLIAVELEDIRPPPAKFIIDQINTSDALFVSLSRPLERLPHTRNWVSFEIGLAANRPWPALILGPWKIGIDIIVFEPFEYHNTPIQFPVPYFNYYVEYENNNTWVKIIRTLVEYGPEYVNHELIKPIKCPYGDCRIEFGWIAPSGLTDLTCPACRRGIQVLGE